MLKAHLSAFADVRMSLFVTQLNLINFPVVRSFAAPKTRSVISGCVLSTQCSRSDMNVSGYRVRGGDRLPVHSLAHLIAVRPDEALADGVDLRRADRFVIDKLANVLEISDGSARTGFCCATARPALGWASTDYATAPRASSRAFMPRGFSGDPSNAARFTGVVCATDVGNAQLSSHTSSLVTWPRIGQERSHRRACADRVPTDTTHCRRGKREARTVELLQRSSYAAGCTPPQNGETIAQRMGLASRDYAMVGGGFPIFVRGVGFVGAVAVSGLPQREDHAMLVEALAGLCEVNLSAVALED